MPPGLLGSLTTHSGSPRPRSMSDLDGVFDFVAHRPPPTSPRPKDSHINGMAQPPRLITADVITRINERGDKAVPGTKVKFFVEVNNAILDEHIKTWTKDKQSADSGRIWSGLNKEPPSCGLSTYLSSCYQEILECM